MLLSLISIQSLAFLYYSLLTIDYDSYSIYFYLFYPNSRLFVLFFFITTYNNFICFYRFYPISHLHELFSFIS